VLTDVVLLRRKGLRLRPSELAPPVRGILDVRDNTGVQMALKRPYREARLYELIGVSGIPRNLLPGIVDVEVLRIEGDTITLSGLETESLQTDSDHRVLEHHQIWRCVVVRT
jgi:hypothetical protein